MGEVGESMVSILTAGVRYQGWAVEGESDCYVLISVSWEGSQTGIGEYELAAPSLTPGPGAKNRGSVEWRIVVAYDGTPATRCGLRRAEQLGDDIVVAVTGATEPPQPSGDRSHFEIRQVAEISPFVICALADDVGASLVVAPEALVSAVELFKAGLRSAAERKQHRTSTPLMVLFTRGEANLASQSYRSVLVASDGWVGSEAATHAAAGVAAQAGARCDIECAEQRSDTMLRSFVDAEIERDPNFDPSRMRRSHGQASQNEELRRMIGATGIDAAFTYRTGDPSRILVPYAREGDYDLVVSSVGGVGVRGRQGEVGRHTRALLRCDSADHLLVFTDVSDAAVPVVKVAAVTAVAALLFTGTAQATSSWSNADMVGPAAAAAVAAAEPAVSAFDPEAVEQSPLEPAAPAVTKPGLTGETAATSTGASVDRQGTETISRRRTREAGEHPLPATRSSEADGTSLPAPEIQAPGFPDGPFIPEDGSSSSPGDAEQEATDPPAPPDIVAPGFPVGPFIPGDWPGAPTEPPSLRASERSETPGNDPGSPDIQAPGFADGPFIPEPAAGAVAN